MKHAYFAMSLEVEYRETADVTNPINVNSKFSEKIDNSLTTIRKRKPQDERCGQHTQHLFHKHHNFQIVEGSKLPFDLFKSAFATSGRTSSECSLPFQ